MKKITKKKMEFENKKNKALIVLLKRDLTLSDMAKLCFDSSTAKTQFKKRVYPLLKKYSFFKTRKGAKIPLIYREYRKRETWQNQSFDILESIIQNSKSGRLTILDNLEKEIEEGRKKKQRVFRGRMPLHDVRKNAHTYFIKWNSLKNKVFSFIERHQDKKLTENEKKLISFYLLRLKDLGPPIEKEMLESDLTNVDFLQILIEYVYQCLMGDVVFTVYDKEQMDNLKSEGRKYSGPSKRDVMLLLKLEYVLQSLSMNKRMGYLLALNSRIEEDNVKLTMFYNRKVGKYLPKYSF